jgi:hypothetical protein
MRRELIEPFSVPAVGDLGEHVGDVLKGGTRYWATGTCQAAGERLRLASFVTCWRKVGTDLRIEA